MLSNDLNMLHKANDFGTVARWVTEQHHPSLL